MVSVAPRPPASSYSADFRSELEDCGLCCDDKGGAAISGVRFCKLKGV